MLDTESRLTALAVWLVILAICARATWQLLGLGAPTEIAQALAASEAWSAIQRNQVLVTGLAGFGGLALAYLFNGWRDRAERRHVIERSDKRLAGVLAREAEALAGVLEAAAPGNAPAGARARLAEIVEGGDSLLLAAPMADLSRLGAGATDAVQTVRRSLKRISLRTDTRDEGSQRQLGADVLRAAVATRSAARVLKTLDEKGVTAADRIRMIPPCDAEIADMARALGEQAGTRLLPAA
jgi:hypothetical protein